MSYTHPHSEIMCFCSCEPRRVGLLPDGVLVSSGRGDYGRSEVETLRIIILGGITLGGLCVMTLADIECRVRVQGCRQRRSGNYNVRSSMAWLRSRCDWWEKKGWGNGAEHGHGDNDKSLY